MEATLAPHEEVDEMVRHETTTLPDLLTAEYAIGRIGSIAAKQEPEEPDLDEGQRKGDDDDGTWPDGWGPGQPTSSPK